MGIPIRVICKTSRRFCAIGIIEKVSIKSFSINEHLVSVRVDFLCIRHLPHWQQSHYHHKGEQEAQQY